MRRLLRHLRSVLRVRPGKPAIGAGLRTALATAVPLVLAFLLGVKDASWGGLSGLLVSLADKGGSYRTRAKELGAVTLLGAVVGALGAPGGTTPWLDVSLMWLGVTAAAYARSYGETAGSVGGQLAVIFVVSLGAPAVAPEDALARGGWLLFGGLWAMVLSLVLWPLRPYQPARRAIARVYRALAEASWELGRLSREGAGSQAWVEAAQRHMNVRPLMEHARATLGASRGSHMGKSRRGEHLLVLLETCEPMSAQLIALAEAMEGAVREPRFLPLRGRVDSLCDAYAAMAGWVEQVLLHERNDGVPRAPRLAPRSRRRGDRPASGIRSREDPLSLHVDVLFGKLRQLAGVAHETASGLLHGDPVSDRGRSLVGREERRVRSWLAPLRDHLRADSLVFRHALRVGLVATVALVVTQALGIRDAHWVSLTVIAILQPYSAITEERALQRVGGTLLGACLAAVIATRVHSPSALLTVIVLLTAVSVALLPINFGAFQVLLTPDYLLLATLSSGDWSLAGQRALGVLVACTLALLGAWVLWPMPERRRFPDAAAAALRADGDYLREVISRRSADRPEVGAARRSFGLALLDAEASFERLTAEYHGPPQQLESGMAVITYARRFATVVTALGMERPEAEVPGQLRHLAHQAGRALDDLAESLNARRAPAPLPPLQVSCKTDDPVFGALLERVPRQLGMLHGAVTRLSAGPILR
ncbi:FUSC family protein [Myxococcus hansupus]|uniref:FUSC family protein n=1 Tax=Pseudomyxococcus hansupus TaxID=1297742 RepID=UPI0005D12501|nr:FUSC family protein [Myxococcus hansupus]